MHLRVNIAKISREAVLPRLAKEGITAVPHALAETALEVTEGARRVQGSPAYRDGLVELQDAASQAVVAALGPLEGLRVLDYCAGGGGKALAMAARGARVVAHDINPGRMRDIPARAARAGVRIDRAAPGEITGAFDLVLGDAPCSGSGSWRRAPQGKWSLNFERLDELCAIQDEIIKEIPRFTEPDGRLAYATCSLLAVENGDRVSAFRAAHPEWQVRKERRVTPLDGGDGFYVAVLGR